MTSSIQEAYPIRQKGMHFVNPSAGFDALFKIFHGFLSKKIQERVCIFIYLKISLILSFIFGLDVCARLV